MYFPPHEPVTHPRLRDLDPGDPACIFDVVRKDDILLHREAIARFERREILLPPPTWTTIRQLEKLPSIEAAFDWARSQRIVRVMPAMLISVWKATQETMPMARRPPIARWPAPVDSPTATAAIPANTDWSATIQIVRSPSLRSIPPRVPVAGSWPEHRRRRLGQVAAGALLVDPQKTRARVVWAVEKQLPLDIAHVAARARLAAGRRAARSFASRRDAGDELDARPAARCLD
ncbi:MAG: hypothetical protein HC794_01235 [Nitrospiraceae bacterium]|nr:hypothetical protein [Nitrospiraceae bacterium]